MNMNELDRMLEAARREERKRIAKTVVLICAIIAVIFGAYAIGRQSSTTANEPKPKEPTVESPQPISRPPSGRILYGREYDGSEITVTADSSHDCVVTIKNMYGNEYVSFYVRSGETVTVGVPSEFLQVFFASGKTWYGYGKGLMFGDQTSYSKDDGLQDFEQYTWSYKLYPVTNGNFSETPIDEDEYFS